MTLRQFIQICNEDKTQWRKELGKNINFFFLFIFLREYRIVVLFRMCAYLRSHWYFFFIYCIVRLFYRHLTLSNGVDIPSHVEIGGGLGYSSLKWNCNSSASKNRKKICIHSGCVIGYNGEGVPVICDNVIFGVHATVIGGVIIEAGCIIGAGAVVTKSTESNGIYAGVPARRIKERV